MDYLFHYYPNHASYEVDVIDFMTIESSAIPFGQPTYLRVKRTMTQEDNRNVRKCIRKDKGTGTGTFKRVAK